MSREEVKQIEGLEKTTPFDRGQILDLYTKFKALCHLSALRGHKYEDKSHYKHLDIVNNYLKIKAKDDKSLKECSLGVNVFAFTQGLMECRIYNQGILKKIFEYLDEDGKGYLNWDKFLEGMKIVFSTSEVDKVDLFLRMSDEDGGGSFGFDEIKEICLLTTFETKSSEMQPKYDKYGNKEIDILDETAEFQAQNIFELLKYDVDDEIPMEVFKH